jgi:hypothetical protein
MKFGRRGTLASLAALLIIALVGRFFETDQLFEMLGLALLGLCISGPTWIYGMQLAEGIQTVQSQPDGASTPAAVVPRQSSSIGPVLSLLLLPAMGWFYFGGGLEHVASSNMKDINVQVAKDSIDEYDITKRQGDPMEICVHAGLVAAAYLQAKDGASYEHWKIVEKRDCAAAGLAK